LLDRTTPVEWAALLEAIAERDREHMKHAQFHAGIVAAEVRNTMRSKDTDRIWTAKDFLPKEDGEEPEPEQRITRLLEPKYLKREMDNFAKSHNRSRKAR
jgi:hypothetical protein